MNPVDYNCEPEIRDIIVTEENSVNMSFDVRLNDGSDPLYPKGDDHYLYDMTGEQLDMHIRNKKGTVIYHFSSAGPLPEITIIAHTWNLSQAVIDRVRGTFKYDLLKTNGAEELTIRKGNWKNEKQYTI